MKQKRLVSTIQTMEDSNVRRKIKLAWIAHPRLYSFSDCCISLSEAKENNTDMVVEYWPKLGGRGRKTQTTSGSDEHRNIANVNKFCGLPEAYRENKWIGKPWRLWSQHTTMQCKSGLSTLLNYLNDEASSSGDEDDYFHNNGESDHASYYCTSDDGSDDMYSSDDSESRSSLLSNLADFSRENWQVDQNLACQASSAICLDFRELCIENSPRAPPPEIT